MRIQSESIIPHPQQRVFLAYRDQLPAVVPFLDDIKAIRVISREEQGDKVVLHNEWESGREIPAVAAKIIRPDQLHWDDYATWDSTSHSCAWVIRTRAFTEAVSCQGSTRLVPEGNGTRVVLSGELTLHLKEIPGIPNFLAKGIIPQVEKFIVSLIEPNLAKTNVAIARYLDTQA